MSYEIKGMAELERELLKQFGVQQTRVISRNAIKAGAEAFDKVLKPELESFKDTGATVDEVTYDESKIDSYDPKITIRWQGPHERYRIIHLNEFGYNKNGKKIKPRGYGKLAKALAEGQTIYYNAVKKELEKGLK